MPCPCRCPGYYTIFIYMKSKSQTKPQPNAETCLVFRFIFNSIQQHFSSDLCLALLAFAFRFLLFSVPSAWVVFLGLKLVVDRLLIVVILRFLLHTEIEISEFLIFLLLSFFHFVVVGGGSLSSQMIDKQVASILSVKLGEPETLWGANGGVTTGLIL